MIHGLLANEVDERVAGSGIKEYVIMKYDNMPRE